MCAAIFAAGYCVGVSAADKAVPTLPEPVPESTATPEPSAEPSVAPTPSPTPVSYTHLDVYKRQAVLWILLAVSPFRLHDSHILRCAFPHTSARV